MQINTAVIELIAGLLSAYHLTDDLIFVTKAAELADLYLLNFDTPTGLPYRLLNLTSGVSVM